MSTTVVQAQALAPALALEIRRSRTVRQRQFQAFSRNIPAVIALVVLAAMILMAIFAPIVAPQDPLAQKLTDRLHPPFWIAGGSAGHLLGTDQLGRDVLSRIVWGARPSLTLGFGASSISLALGLTLGLLAGLSRGKTGAFIMRAADAQLAFPYLVAAIAIIAVVGTKFISLLILLAFLGWAAYAKVTRAQVLSVKNQEYVQAARVIGAGSWRIMIRHIVPNVLSPLLVLYTFSIALIIIIEASLSFLGLGVPPPAATWGSMLADGQTVIDSAWWLELFPGLAILLTVLSVNVLGDALRDVFDPHLQGAV